MTALAPVVITASVLTIILQIVLIILVLDSKKKTKVVPEEKLVHHENREPRKPRESENRFNRKPPHDLRAKPAPAQVAATLTQNPDQMERSLRDINLRLKNAEQDQEKERRRIKDSIGNQPQQKRNDFSRPRDRNEGFRRNDRQPRQDFQGRASTEPNKPMIREDKPNRMPVALEPKEIKPPVIVPVANPVIIPPSNPIVVADPIVPTISKIQPVEQKTKLSNIIFEEESTETGKLDNLQHGRKFAVKRRVLKAGEAEGSESGAETQTNNATPPLSATLAINPSENISEPNRSNNAVTPSESNISGDIGSSGPISFGR